MFMSYPGSCNAFRVKACKYFTVVRSLLPLENSWTGFQLVKIGH